MKPDGNVRILLAIPSTGCNLIWNITKVSHRKFFAEGVPEKTNPKHTKSDIREWKFIRQSLELKNTLNRQVVRLAKKDGDSRPWLIKITFPSSNMAAST